MDVIKSLIGILLRIMFAAFFVAFVWWLISLLYPALSMVSLKTTIFGDEKKDLLPSPRAYSGLLSRASSTPQFKPVTFDQSAYSYTVPQSDYTYSSAHFVVYGATGTTVVDIYGNTVASSYAEYMAAQQKTTPTNTTATSTGTVARSMYIRNLSIYEGGRVGTNLSFVGEARSTMFRNGSFPIVLLDHNKKVIGVSAAVATTNWSVPGWTRFETKLSYPIPIQSQYCTLVFQEALTEGEQATRQPVRIPLAVGCN